MKTRNLKFVGYALAGIGMIVASALQTQEIREAVDEALDEREKSDKKDKK